MRGLRYWLRRAVVVLAHYDHIACTVPSCPEPRVGITAWCRRHVDEIMAHDHSPELDEALDAIRTGELRR